MRLLASRAASAFIGAALLVACASAPPPRQGTDEQQPHLPEEHLAALAKARTLIDAQDPRGAVTVLDGVTQYFEQKYKDEKRRVYSARTTTETLLYLTTALKDSHAAVAIGPEWTSAYHMKAYALVEIGDADGARKALEKARVLSPSNSLVLSELGYVRQLSKDWQGMLALYTEAETAADFSPDSEKASERSRALRGQGFALIELGRLDEAEGIFRKCLAENPDDKKAQNELDYIGKLRRR